MQSKLLSLSVLTLLVGCSRSSIHHEAVETKTLYLSYHITPSTKPGMNAKGTTITVDGNSLHFVRDYPLGEELDTNIVLSNEERTRIADFLELSDVFALKENYINEGCRDGGIESLQVKLGKRRRSVSIYCTKVELVENLRELLHRFVNQ